MRNDAYSKTIFETAVFWNNNFVRREHSLGWIFGVDRIFIRKWAISSTIFFHLFENVYVYDLFNWLRILSALERSMFKSFVKWTRNWIHCSAWAWWAFLWTATKWLRQWQKQRIIGKWNRSQQLLMVDSAKFQQKNSIPTSSGSQRAACCRSPWC